MKLIRRFLPLVLVLFFASAKPAPAQVRPYIGYAYPAGGQQGTTFEIKLGGQNLDDVYAVTFTGAGVNGEVVEYLRRLNAQETQLLNEQLRELKRATSSVSPVVLRTNSAESKLVAPTNSEDSLNMVARIEKRIREFVPTPACDSIATPVIVRATITPYAEPGEREIRLVTTRGISNPLVFHVGQFAEYSRKPMIAASKQVLGKEEQALRKRPANEAEDRVSLPCTLNGQIASGEINRYRFEVRKGQRLVVTTRARELIPFVADAVPGWFQPVVALYDSSGKEVAYDDDYFFDPDPSLVCDVPKDGEYVLAIYDSIYRGREDFVYRITIAESPFLTSVFPMGAQVGTKVSPAMKGWNLQDVAPSLPDKDATGGIQFILSTRNGIISNRMPFVFDALPDIFESEPNNSTIVAQKITPPVIINGHIDVPDDWDVFKFTGKSNEVVVAEVQARRLLSPVDSVLKLTDSTGKVITFNDDHEDLGAGISTHLADSYFRVTLPDDGLYYLHIGDTARKGGSDYGYRLRISAPQPDFELRVVPSSISLRTNSTAALTVYAARKDGFAGSIKLTLKDPPAGFSAASVTLQATQTLARFTFKGPVAPTKDAVSLSIVGTAKIGETAFAREAVPAEDRMQAFLWRHLVPAKSLQVLVFDPGYQLSPKRIAPVVTLPASPAVTNALALVRSILPTNAVASTNILTGTNATSTATPPKPKITQQQVTARLRQLRLLFEEGLLTESFYSTKVIETQPTQ